ncbi:class I SAM-dependent methyltransferase [Candidatus Woesearchaeota archaeon]|jgi:malonyl-CoA O-methyltransferase|nr:class I SAM-dependent methyltransferase [Candidatus Woesearchaeota archaeon]
MNYYDGIASGYEELHLEEQMQKLKMIEKDLHICKTDKLLDVGCGSGISTRYWNNKCDSLIGIDPSEKLLEIARLKDTNGTYDLGSAEKLPFKDCEFDVVISITAIQNFDNPRQGLLEIKRVGKKRFALTVLKKSPKIEEIKEIILDMFTVKKIVLEEKDIMFIC